MGACQSEEGNAEEFETLDESKHQLDERNKTFNTHLRAERKRAESAAGANVSTNAEVDGTHRVRSCRSYTSFEEWEAAVAEASRTFEVECKPANESTVKNGADAEVVGRTKPSRARIYPHTIHCNGRFELIFPAKNVPPAGCR